MVSTTLSAFFPTVVHSVRCRLELYTEEEQLSAIHLRYNATVDLANRAAQRFVAATCRRLANSTELVQGAEGATRCVMLAFERWAGGGTCSADIIEEFSDGVVPGREIGSGAVRSWYAKLGLSSGQN